MTSQNCLVCATDEGLFLDIFTHGKGFRDKNFCIISLEVQKNKSSSKICYKCAYELIDCRKFIDKFNKVHENYSQKIRKTGHCGLCQEPEKKGFIYELRNEKLQNAFNQIYDIFHRDLSSTFKTLHVCLYCRYNLDVLFDLKKVAENPSTSADKKIDVKVIKRKTTNPPSPQLRLHSSDSDTPLTPMKKKSTKLSSSPQNDRQCDKCSLKVESNIGMYRFYQTGETVCKDCWSIMDPGKPSTRSQKTTLESSTKLCSVFLKDVLINPPKIPTTSKKSTSPIGEEKDTDGNTIYVISDDSDTETAPRNSRKGIKRASSENDTKSTKRSKKLFEQIPRRETRASSVMSSVTSLRTSPRVPPKRRYSGTFEIPELGSKKLRSKAKKNIKEDESVKIEAAKAMKSVRSTKAPKQQISQKNQSSSDESTKGSRRNSKLLDSRDKSYSLPLSRASSMSSRSRRENLADEEDKLDVIETRKSKRDKNKNDSKSQELPSDNDKTKKTKKLIKEKKDSSDDSRTQDSNRVSLSPVAHEKSEDNEINEEIIKTEEKIDSDDNQSYSCTICSTEFETRVEGMTHELTHSKKLEVLLKKVSVSDVDEEEGEEVKEEEKNNSIEIIEDEKSEEKIDSEEVKKAEEKEAGPDNDKLEEKPEEESEKIPEENGKDEEKSGDVDEISEKQKSPDVEEPEAEENDKCNDEPAEKAPEETPPVDAKEEKKETKENLEDSPEGEVVEVEDDKKNEEISEEVKIPEESLAEPEEPSEPVEDAQGVLTNVEKADDSDKKEEEATNLDVDDKLPVDEEKDVEVSGTHEEDEKNEENVKNSEECEERKESDEDSDEEKSPEPEPLSPVPQSSPIDEDDEDTLPEEDVTEVVDKSNCDRSDELNKSASDCPEVSTEITNGNQNNDDVDSESHEKIVEPDDASMEAIEKQMQTIVGDENVNKNNYDNKDITDVSAVNEENIDEA